MIKLPEVVGKGYGDFWRFKGRYRVVKGSRASKKSTTTAMNMIYRIMKYPQSNVLVVRKTFRTLQDSCFAQLKWAIRRLNVEDYFDYKYSPLEIVYRPTGQKILFRGLDDPLKVTSVTIDVGYICFLWIEEAYEITDESDFDMLDESIRGEVPDGLFKQITLTLNPWNERHWIKKRFFDAPKDPDIFTLTTNYMINEWLDESDLKVFERMKKNNPSRYQVAGLGEWGIVSGLILRNWEVKDISQDLNDYDDIAMGQDYGYNHANAILLLGIKDDDIYILKELYLYEKVTSEIIELAKGVFPKDRIMYCDSAESDRTAEWQKAGYEAIKVKKEKTTAKKYQATQIDWLKGRNIYIHPSCTNTLKEIDQWRWKKNEQTGEYLDEPIPFLDDAMSALRYGIEGWRKPNKIEVNLFKGGI